MNTEAIAIVLTLSGICMLPIIAVFLASTQPRMAYKPRHAAGVTKPPGDVTIEFNRIMSVEYPAFADAT